MLSFYERLGANRLKLDPQPLPIESGDLLLELRGRVLHSGSAHSLLVAETDLTPHLQFNSADTFLAEHLAGLEPGGDEFARVVEEALGLSDPIDLRGLLFQCAENEMNRYRESRIHSLVTISALWAIGDAWSFSEDPPYWIDLSRGLGITIAEGGEDSAGARAMALELLANLKPQ